MYFYLLNSSNFVKNCLAWFDLFVKPISTSMIVLNFQGHFVTFKSTRDKTSKSYHLHEMTYATCFSQIYGALYVLNCRDKEIMQGIFYFYHVLKRFECLWSFPKIEMIKLCTCSEYHAHNSNLLNNSIQPTQINAIS